MKKLFVCLIIMFAFVASSVCVDGCIVEQNDYCMGANKNSDNHINDKTEKIADNDCCHHHTSGVHRLGSLTPASEQLPLSAQFYISSGNNIPAYNPGPLLEPPSYA